MSEEENQFVIEENERKWPLWWVIFPILLVLSLCASGYLYYKYYKSTYAIDGQSYQSKYNDAVVKYDTEKQQLNKDLDEVREQLRIAIQDKNAEIASLKDQIDAKTIELARKIRSANVGNPKALQEAKAEIERLKGLQQMLQQQNSSLTASNKEYIAKILQVETSAEEANSRATKIEEEKTVLDEKIKNSTLNVADLRVIGIRKKGSTEEETFKAFKTDKLKISFTILGNDLVEAGNKEITIRLIGTNKEVLTNDNEKLSDSDKLSTMVQAIDFQNEPIKTTIYYTQKATYKKGTYTVELIHNDKLMGRAAFILR